MLETIFEMAAPRMTLMRKLLKLNPELFEIVDFLDFVEAMKNMHENDKPLFKERFPTLQSTNVMGTSTFDEVVTNGCTLPKLQKMIEDVLGKDKKCTVSIMFNEHVVTGCFIAKVEFHDCHNTLNLLMHLLMCLFCQTKKAYFVDSNFAEFWVHGNKITTVEAILRPTRAAARQFGARVTMDIAGPKKGCRVSVDVENFMKCLYWWMSCRWSPIFACNFIRYVFWGVDGVDSE